MFHLEMDIGFMKEGNISKSTELLENDRVIKID